MMTLQQIRDEFLALMAETADQTHFSDVNVVNRFANNGIEMTAILSENARDLIQIPVELDIATYTLPSDNILIKTAYFGNSGTTNEIAPIKIVTEEVLRNLHPGWLDETSATSGQPRYLVQLNRKDITLYPKPNSDWAGKNLTINYVYRPYTLNADSDIPDISAPYQPLIKFYMAFLAYSSLKNPEMSTKNYNDWLTHYNLIKGTVNKETEETFRFNWAFTEN